MRNTKILSSLLILIILLCMGCQNRNAQRLADLNSLNLRRGDIALCGSGKFGEISFSSSCSDDTQEPFDLALSLLHSFEYAEAEKAFVKVIDKDPDCVMAYWGVTMSIFHSLWMQSDLGYLGKGSALLKIASTIPQSEREEAYLDAIGIFYKDWDSVDKQTRKLWYEQKMALLSEKYKDDKEAAVFYALALTASADPNDKQYIKQRKSGQILESLFVDQPNHPGIAHYIIHTYDSPELASLALPTARKYADIAPASAHAQHMPSHIFTRLGLWEESINTNLNSISSALCYSTTIDPDAHWAQELHAMDYLVYAYLQQGNNEKAIEQYEYLQTFKKTFPSDHFAIAYASAAIPSRIALENKNWNQAASLRLPTHNFAWEKFSWDKAILHFARGMGSIRLGDIESSEKELVILKDLQQQLIDLNDDYKSNQVHIQIKIVQGWISFEKGQNDQAVALLEEAAIMEEGTSKHAVTPGEVLPARELQGDLYLAMSKPKKALEAYLKDMNRHPNRFNGLYGAATAAKNLGDSEKAAEYFSQLLKLGENYGSERPEIIEAKEFIARQAS